ncbi:MAG: hypothetical protein AVDCRST_MAG77-4011, partial [uncultured Chloroflexi bacterium]
ARAVKQSQGSFSFRARLYARVRAEQCA